MDVPPCWRPPGGAAMLAGCLRGQMVPPDALLELWAAHQQGQLRTALPSLTMPLPGSQVGLLPGTRSHGQARSPAGLWEPLLAALKALEGTGRDALVDVGRLGLVGWPTPLLHGDDLALIVCHSPAAVATAFGQPARVVESSPVGASGLAGFATAELGPTGTG